MEEALQNDLDNKWIRYLLVAALLSGTGGGLASLTQTDDRFRGRDFDREILTRDRRVERLENYVRDHTAHSATYSAIVEATKADIDNHLESCGKEHAEFFRRLREIDVKLARNGDRYE
jgi:hypothetical protein